METQDANRDRVVAEWDDTDEPSGREIRVREGETERVREKESRT